MDTSDRDLPLTTRLKTWIKKRFQYRPVVHGLGFIQRSKTPSKPMGREAGGAQARLERLTKFSDAVRCEEDEEAKQHE